MHFLCQASLVCKHHHVGGRLVTHPMPEQDEVCPPALECLPAPVDWVVELPRSLCVLTRRSRSQRRRKRSGGRMGGGLGGGFLVRWGFLSLPPLCQIAKGRRGGEEGGALSHTMHRQFHPRSEAKNVGDLRACAVKTKDTARPFGVCSSMPSHNACSGRENGLHVHQDLGVRRDATIERTAAGFTGLPPRAPRGGGKSVWLAAIPVSDFAGRACSLQAQSIYAYDIHICTVYSNAERYPVLENRPHMCAGGTGSGEISNRNTSPKYQPVPWLQ